MAGQYFFTWPTKRQPAPSPSNDIRGNVLILDKTDEEIFIDELSTYNASLTYLEGQEQDVKRLKNNAEQAICTAEQAFKELVMERLSMTKLLHDVSVTMNSVSKSSDKIEEIMNTHLDARGTAARAWHEIASTQASAAKIAMDCAVSLETLTVLTSKLQEKEKHTMNEGIVGLQHAISTLQQKLESITNAASVPSCDLATSASASVSAASCATEEMVTESLGKKRKSIDVGEVCDVDAKRSAANGLPC